MGLLENLLAKLLSEKAGDFLKVSKEQLRASLSGDLALTGVELQVDALNELMGNSPVALRSCKIGLLKAKIPWDHLSSRSVRIALSNVEVLLVPQAVDKNAPGDSFKDVLKKQRLAATEVLMQEQLRDPSAAPKKPAAQPGAPEDEDSDPDEAEEPQKRMRMSLLQRIVARVADNLIITIENLHVRFEDGDTLPTSKFALGLHLESLSLATDASGASAFVDRTVRPPPALLRRRVQVHGLNVYWESLNGSGASMASARRHLIRPLGATVALTQHLAPDAPVAVTIEAKTEGVLSVILDTDEYRDLAVLTERITAHESFVTQSAIWRLRPTQPPSVNPRRWWHYAIRAVQTVLRSTTESHGQKKSSWPSLVRLVKTRRRYVHFFKQRLIKADPKFLSRASRLAASSSAAAAAAAAGEHQPPSLHRQSSLGLGPAPALSNVMAESEQADAVLSELELELPFNTIMLFRAMAEAEFREERARLRKLHRSKRMASRALSAMAQGAAAGKKMLSQGFRLGSSNQLSHAGGSSASTVGSTLETAASQQPQPGPASTWAMDSAEKSALYKAVTLDPSTAWLIERAGGGGESANASLNVSMNIHLQVPLVLVSLSLSPREPIMDVGLGVLSVDAKLGGSKQKYAVEAQLQSLEFIDKTPREFADFRGVPGTLRTLADGNHSLLRASVASVGTKGRESIGVEVEVRPMDITLSLGLIDRLVRLTRVNEVAHLAPATMERMRQLGRRTAQDLNQALKMGVDVKVDWDLPTVLIPLFSQSSGSAVALDLALGRLRVRSQGSGHNIECHGIHAGVRRIEQTSLAQWKAMDVSTSVPVVNKFDVDVTIVPTGKLGVRVDVTQISVRLDPALLVGIANALPLYSLPPVPKGALNKAPSLTSALGEVVLSLTKVEVVLGVPRYRQGLRVKRPCWGADFPGNELPSTGALRFRLGELHVSKSALDDYEVRLSSIALRDELQCGGSAFRDLVTTGPCSVSLKQHFQLAVRLSDPLLLSWNPSTVDALCKFAQSLMPTSLQAPRTSKQQLPLSPTAPQVPKPLSRRPSPLGSMQVEINLPELALNLNQETIGSRLAIAQLRGLSVSVAASRINVGLEDLTVQCVQWEPLTATTGVKLLGRGTGGDSDALLPSSERLLDLEVSIADPIVRVSFEVRRIRFLWAHTLTKQVADYVSDGVSGVIKTHFAKPVVPRDGKLAVLIEGKVTNAAVAVPKLRFGKMQRYERGGSADEILATVAQVDLGVSLFEPRPAPATEALYRADDHMGPGTDATMTRCHLPPEPEASGLGYLEPAVEIRMSFSGVDVTGVHRKQQRENVMATGISGKLAWHIVDFTPAQKALRARQSPLTAREQARLDADIVATGGAIPFGEHPHGVSPQKFELAVDADTIKLNVTMDDVMLIGGVVLENILDHRRRLACVPAPKLPLFTEEEQAELGNEMAVGCDELIGSTDRGDIALYHAHSVEVLPPGLSADQLAFDALGFSGNAPAFVDLDLSLRFPHVFVTLLSSSDASQLPLLRATAVGFEMNLSELYDRTQFVDISLQQVLVEVPASLAGSSKLVKMSPMLPRSGGRKQHQAEYIVVLEAGEPRRRAFGNPPITRSRVREVLHVWQNRPVRTEWQYARAALPLYISVTRWPAKDRRVEVGVNQVEVNPDARAILRLLSALPPPPPPRANAPVKVGRAEVVELHISKFAVRWRRPMTEPELVVKGCAKVIISINRARKQRVALETRIGVALRTSTSDSLSADEPSILSATSVTTQQPSDLARQHRASLQSAEEVSTWLEAVYRVHNPVKLAEVGSIVHAFDGHFDELVSLIRAKYHLSADDSFASEPLGGHAVKETVVRVDARGAPFRRHEAMILDPLGARIDVSVVAKVVAVTIVCEPLHGRLTNGQVEACRAVALAAAANLDGDNGLPALPISKPRGSNFESSLQLTVHAQGASFSLINDYGSSHSIPLVRLTISGLAVQLVRSQLASVTIESFKLNAVAPAHSPGGEPSISLDSFNPRILAWESLVEPFSLTVDFERELHKAEMKRLAVRINLERGLDANFTFAFVESFAYWLACRSARRRGSFNVGSRHAEHYIVNDSGSDIVFWADGFEDERVELPPKTRAGLRLSSARFATDVADSGLFRDTRVDLRIGEDRREQVQRLLQRDDDGVNLRRRVVSLSLGWPGQGDSGLRYSLRGVQAHRFGTFVYPVSGPTGQPAGKITLHVSLEHGSRVIRVLSPVQIVNATALPILLLLTGPEEQQQQRAMGPLQPGEACSIPMDCLTWSFCYRALTSPLPISANRERGPDLDLDAARATSNAADALGYSWGPTVSLLDIHKLVDQPMTMICPRNRSFTYEGRGRAKSEEGVGGGGVYYLATCMGVESFASSDEAGKRETYVVTLLPLVKVENRLPVDLLLRSLRREGDANLPVSGHRILPGLDADLAHVVSRSPSAGGTAAAGASKRASPRGEASVEEVAPLWLSVSVPGLDWSSPFQPGTLSSLLLVHKSTMPLRIMFENERSASGSIRITVYAESWLVNDSRMPVAFREGIVAGETFISEIGQRGGAAAQLMWDLGHNLRDRAFKRALSSSGASPSPEAEGDHQLESDEGDDENNDSESSAVDKVVLFSEGRLLSLRVGDSPQWSSAVAIDTVGAHRDVVCTHGGSDERVVVSMAVKLAPGKFRRTRLVVIHPRVVVVNRVPGYLLRIASELAKRPITIETGASSAVHFFDPASLKNTEDNEPGDEPADEESSEVTRFFPRLVVALEGSSNTWGWSGAFRISDAGKLAIKVHSRHSGETRVLRVLFASRGPTTAVVVEPENNAHPMYRVLNQSEEVVHYYQVLLTKTLFSTGAGKKRRGVVERAFKGESRPFGWDEPTAESPTVALSFRGDSFVHECSIDALSSPVALQLPASKSQPSKTLWVAVRIRGTTKTLLITSTSPSVDAVHSAEERARVASDDTPPISLCIHVARIGLSLVDRAPQELLLVTLTDVCVECARTAAMPTVDEDDLESAGLDSLDVSVRLIQIDSQLPDAYFPVLLGPARSWLAQPPAERPNVLQMSIVRRNGHAGEFDFFEFASLQMVEMDLKIDDSILLLLGRMMWECIMSLRTEEELVVGQVLSNEGPASRLRRWLVAAPAPPGEAAGQPSDLNLQKWISDAAFTLPQSFDRDVKRAYFRLLHLQGIRVNLSFRFTASDPRAVLSLAKFRSSGLLRGDDFNEGALGRPALFDVDLVMSWLPPALINIDNARLRLHALYAPHMLVDREQLIDTIVRHYSQQALYQVYRVVGSSDVMGNPLGVLRDIGAGVEDFFSRPLQGLRRASPTLFIQGLGQGTFSLLRHATLGSFDFLSKLSGAVGAGVALMTLDYRFVSQRWTRLRFEQPRHAAAGLAMGFRALMLSVVEGAGGLVIGPMRSLMNEGTPFGFARELGLGVVGVFVKPVVGVLDLASRAATGMRASVEAFDGRALVAAQRQRLPRAFKGPERRLDPFVLEEAFVADLLKRLEGEDRAYDYIAHVALHGSYCLVLGGGRLWCLDYRNKASVVWSISLAACVDVQATSEPNFPALHIFVRTPSDLKRVRPRDGRHGAEDAELVVRGGDQEARYRAVLKVPFDSHERARFAGNVIATALFGDARPIAASSSEPGAVGMVADASSVPPAPARRRVLGLALGPVPRQMVRELAGPSHIGGAGVVLRVVEGSPAHRAGLLEGDVILSIGGQPLDVEDPWSTVRTASSGEPKEIEVYVKRPPARWLKLVLPV